MAWRLAAMGKAGYRDVVYGEADARPGTEPDRLHYQGIWKGNTVLVESALTQPLKWRKPRRIFVVSMGDLFHESVPFEWIDRVFAVMALAQQHTFLVLTKRAERMGEYLQMICDEKDIQRWTNCAMDMLPGIDLNAFVQETNFPLPNVWLGVTVENQEQADRRIPHLLKCPAAHRFLSIEPMLGAVDLSEWFGLYEFEDGKYSLTVGSRWEDSPDAVIIGGESGSSARPCNVEWIRSIVGQCKAAGVSCHVKQLGSNAVYWPCGSGPNCTHPDCKLERMPLRDRAGRDPAEWPAGLREYSKPFTLENRMESDSPPARWRH
jgi:protein gp37